MNWRRIESTVFFSYFAQLVWSFHSDDEKLKEIKTANQNATQWWTDNKKIMMIRIGGWLRVQIAAMQAWLTPPRMNSFNRQPFENGETQSSKQNENQRQKNFEKVATIETFKQPELVVRKLKASTPALSILNERLSWRYECRDESTKTLQIHSFEWSADQFWFETKR